jgi:hypothetical protein
VSINLVSTNLVSTNDAAPPDPKRRRFLAAASGAGALGTLAVLAAPVTAAQATPAIAEAKPSGYHETEHIREYYRTARYW